MFTIPVTQDHIDLATYNRDHKKDYTPQTECVIAVAAADILGPDITVGIIGIHTPTEHYYFTRSTADYQTLFDTRKTLVPTVLTFRYS